MQAINEKEAAEYLGVSVSFLRQTRSARKRSSMIEGPPWIQYGRAIRYDLDDLSRWRDSHRVTPDRSDAPASSGVAS
jgi:hypothetical protein